MLPAKFVSAGIVAISLGVLSMLGAAAPASASTISTETVPMYIVSEPSHSGVAQWSCFRQSLHRRMAFGRVASARVTSRDGYAAGSTCKGKFVGFDRRRAAGGRWSGRGSGAEDGGALDRGLE